MSKNPEGYNTLSAHLVVRNPLEAIEFYKKAFGAVEKICLKNPADGKLLHAALQIGNSTLMLAEENPTWGSTSPQTLNGTPVTIHYYVEDVDKAFQQAVAAGATVKMPLADMFWGDRYGVLQDPYGHSWSLAMKVKEVAPEELQKAAALACGASC